MACLFGHKWDGCICSKCGAKRNENHDWEDGTCKKCGKVSFINKFVVFIAYVGTSELVSLYGQKTALDMIGIDKVDWKSNLINKYPASRSLTQVIIHHDEWAHPHAGFAGNRMDVTPFVTAATKHLTDVVGLSPQEAINATMITANNNITVAASDGLGHGFVVVGVPFK